MRNIFLLLIISLSFSFISYSQKTIDVLTISGHYGFPQKYDSIYNGKAKELGGMVSVKAPIKISEKSYWYNSLNYFYWKVNNDEVMPENIINPIKVQGIVLQTGLYHKFNDKRGIQVLFSPRLMSDFKNISGSHFQFGGTVLYENKYNENLTISFGAMFNQELFGPYLVPLVNLYWKLNNRWSITGLLPVYSKISYKVSENFSFGFNHFGLVTTYKLGEEAYNGDYLERRSIDAGLFGRLKLTGDFYLEGRMGYSFDRNYAQYDAQDKVDFSIPLVSFGDNRVQKNVSFHNGAYANLRIVYSMQLSN